MNFNDFHINATTEPNDPDANQSGNQGRCNTQACRDTCFVTADKFRCPITKRVFSRNNRHAV